MLKGFMMASGKGDAAAASTSALPGHAQPAKVYKNFKLTIPEDSAKPAESASLPKTEPGPASLGQDELPFEEK